DAFGTWLAELKKRLEADQDVREEFLEGGRFVRRRADFLRSEASQRLRAFAQQLEDAELPIDERVRVANSQELSDLMVGPLTAEEVTRLRPWFPVDVDRKLAACAAWYELFPRSQSPVPGRHGTFRDTEARLPDIAALGFDV